MKKELTFEHWAAYLPHRVKVEYTGSGRPFRGTKKIETLTIQNIELMSFSNMRKIHLRPLSQLTETIEHGGERFVPNERMGRPNVELIIDPTLLLYYIVNYMHSLHFDTFGLIEAGLAEPIPSIPQT